MAKLVQHPNGVIYVYHYIDRITPVKLSAKIKLDKTQWNKVKECPVDDKLTFKGKNVESELLKHKKAMNDAVIYLEVNGGMSAENVKMRYKIYLNAGSKRKAVEDNQLRFLDFFAQLVDEYKTEEKSNWKAYKTTLNYLKEFFGRKRPTFDDINTRFYSLFNKFLSGKGLSKNYISAQWKNIKAVMALSLNQKLHTNTEYKLFKRTNEDSDTIALTEEELAKIYNLKLKEKHLQVVRDYFIIGAFTGLRFGDWD